MVYLIASEAFDWVTLANRLTAEVRDIIPPDDLENLLYYPGRFPTRICESDFKEILGADKYSAYQNFHYGVEVEMALQYVVESEVEKRFYAGGRRYTADHTDAAYQTIYRGSREGLFTEFRAEYGRQERTFATFTEIKEFTYWLSKRRLRVSDKAKFASDTRKGIDALESTAQLLGGNRRSSLVENSSDTAPNAAHGGGTALGFRESIRYMTSGLDT